MAKNIRIGKYDLNILSHLLDNSRQKIKDIARKVNCSSATVINRKLFLEKSGVIKKYIPIIDFTKVGYETPLFLLSLRDTSAQNKILEYLRSLDEVGWCIKSFGSWHIIFAAFVKYPKDILLVLDKVFKRFDRKIRDNKVIMVSEGIDKRAGSVVITPIKVHHSVMISNKEKLVLKLLDENCELSFSKLSNKININYKKFKRIVDNLMKKGIIKKFSCQTDYSRIGYHNYCFFIRLKRRTKESFDKASKYFLNLKNIYFLNKLVGDYDFNVQVLLPKDTEIEEIIDMIYTNFGDIIDRFEYLVLGEEYKLTYLPKI